jgi:hypothetical protein
MQTLPGIESTAATSHLFAWLWGSLAVVVFGVYMAVYFLVRTKWGHKTSLEGPPSAVTVEARPRPPAPGS